MPKVTEKLRIYVFPNHQTVILEDVTEVRISASGNHRIKANGKLHLIPTGWIHIEIHEKEWTF